MVCPIWATKSSSVRVGPTVGVRSTPRGHCKVRHHTLRAMADIFKLLALDQSRPRGPRGMRPLQGLDARFFLGTDHVDTLGMEDGGLGIQRAHCGDVFVKLLRLRARL